jgi:outer membrane protein OmpA-like peptidoglycan-associated protein
VRQRFFSPVSARERRDADLFWADLVGQPVRSYAGIAEADGENCSSYEPGEERASRRVPGVLANPVSELASDTLLVADFGTDSDVVKPTTKRDAALINWLALATANAGATFEVIGYTDCVGPPARNDRIRAGRARHVADLIGPLATSVKAAPRGSYVATNATRVGRAMNRGVTIRIVRPPWRRPTFVWPESVAEMQDALDEAEGLLIDPAFLDLRMRRRLYGPGPLPKPWQPDAHGALTRIDASFDFARPLVQPANIKSHGRDDLKATLVGLFHTTDWLNIAAASYAEALKRRDRITHLHDIPLLTDVAVKVKSELAFRAAEKLRVLADEGLSFELELGSAKPAPSYRSDMRKQFTGGAALTKRELRVLAWLQDNKGIILEAEKAFRVDRRAIAAPIAWEAMFNIMRQGLRGVGPGKMHTYSRQLAGVIQFLPKGEAIPQQVEDRGLVPKPKSDDHREIIMATPRGATTYIAAGMRAAIDIAAASGYDISHDIGALSSFYQAHDLPSWTAHIAKKKSRSEKAFVAADPIAVWAISHTAYLESVLGRPAP